MLCATPLARFLSFTLTYAVYRRVLGILGMQSLLGMKLLLKDSFSRLSSTKKEKHIFSIIPGTAGYDTEWLQMHGRVAGSG